MPLYPELIAWAMTLLVSFTALVAVRWFKP